MIARTSADTFRGRAVPADVIGRTLGVRYLLEGSLRAERSVFHINAQLIHAADGRHLWASAFDVDRNELGSARAAIVHDIASALDISLFSVEAERARRERPENADATDLYWRARSVLNRDPTLATLAGAQPLLERAVAHAPDFGAARAELALVLARKVAEYDDPEWQSDYAEAKQLVARALTADPRDPVALAARGYLEWIDGDYAAAESTFRFAIEIDGNSVAARTGLAMCARKLGHLKEVISDEQEVMRLDPASPENARREHAIGTAYLMLGHPGDALVWLKRAGAATGGVGTDETLIDWREWRLIYIMAATELSGDHEKAARLYQTYARLRPRRTIWRLEAFYGRAQSSLPGNAAMLGALASVGMPRFMPEDQDFGIAPPASPQHGGLFAATPLTIPGAQRITTAELAARLHDAPQTPVLDFGSGVAVVPGAYWVQAPEQGQSGDPVTRALTASHAAADRPVVVMSDGPCGWDSYNAALKLVGAGFHAVLWYRGGEEGWKAAGRQSEDRRPE